MTGMGMKTEAARILRNAGHSLDGWRACWRAEQSLRQWVWVNAASLPALWLLQVPGPLAVLIAVVGGLLIVVELLNSAIEAVVDLASPQRHPLAGRAKDAGSAAVAITGLIFAALWLYALLE
jgi:diacylglycerol kinase (ATP)